MHEKEGNMNILKLVNCLLLLVPCICAVAAEPAYVCPKMDCTCLLLDEDTVKASCPAEEHGTEFAVTYNVTEGNIMVDCIQEYSLSRDFLRPFHFTKQVIVHFRMCKAPRLPFDLILKSVNVVGLYFNSYRTWNEVNPQQFFGLSKLKKLNLNGNNFKVLDSNLFEPLVRLRNLSLAQNALETFPQVGNILHQLEGLDLSNNNISKIQPQETAGLTGLQELILFNNSISMLAEGTFADLLNVEKLDLRNNMMITIRPQLLENMTNLRTLDISYNRIISLPHNVFRKNTRLKNLFITNHRNLTEIGDMLLSNLSQLEELDLSFNNLSTLHPKFLFSQHRLLKLQLQSNKFSFFDSQLLAWCTNLEYLDLSSNRLKEIPRGFFKSLIKLKYLFLQNNQIKYLKENLLNGIPLMHYFDISNNGLRSFDKNTFANCGVVNMNFSNNDILFSNSTGPFILPNRVEHVNFSYTFITTIPMNWTRHPTLKDLDLSRNRIYTLHVEYPLPPNKPRNLNVNLQGNIIEDVIIMKTNHSDNDDKPEKFTITFNLDNVALDCNCNLYPFAEYLKEKNNDPKATVKFTGLMKCVSPENLSGIRVDAVSEEQFECRVSKNCPLDCYCYNTFGKQVTNVRCVDQQFVEIPIVLPTGPSIVDLSDNHIENLMHDLPSAQWDGIIELDLSYNRLTDLGQRVDLPKSIMFLSINHNQIHKMPQWLMDEITSRNFKVRLGNNPWDCVCDALPFYNWLNANRESVFDYTNVICMQPQGKPKPLLDLNVTDLCVPTEQPGSHATATGLLIFFLVVIPIIVAVSAIFGYRHWAAIRLWLFRRHWCMWMWQEDDSDSGHPL